jgi:hypothetical protein
MCAGCRKRADDSTRARVRPSVRRSADEEAGSVDRSVTLAVQRAATGRHLDGKQALALQRLAGNQAVERLVSQDVKHSLHKPEVEDKEEDVKTPAAAKERGKSGTSTGTVSAMMVQRGVFDFLTGGKKVAYKPGWRPAPDFKLNKPAPKRSNSDSSTTLPATPTFSGYTAYEAGPKKWRYQVESISSPGKIQIVYYTKDRYPAPTPTDDSGDLSNVTKDNWHAIVKDLTDNRTGIAQKWSAYQAEDLHENYHWVDEWQVTSKPKFDEALTDIAALEMADDGTGPSTQYDANKLLEPLATDIFTKKIREARRAFNALGDSPGDPPYVAQAPAVDALIKRVQDYAAANNWP